MDILTQFAQLKFQLAVIVLQEWHKDLFSPRWWFEAVSLLVIYGVWWKLVDKRRLSEILFFGSLVAVMNVIINITEALYGILTYKVRLIPIMPSVFPFDLTFIPVVFMLSYQYCTPWKRYIWGGPLAAASFSFLFFPLLIQLNILEMRNWNFFYSFIIRTSEAFIARTAIGLIHQVETAQRVASSAEGDKYKPLVPAMKPLQRNDDDKK